MEKNINGLILFRQMFAAVDVREEDNVFKSTGVSLGREVDKVCNVSASYGLSRKFYRL